MNFAAGFGVMKRDGALTAELDALAGELSAMGGWAEAQLADVIDALERGDVARAEKIQAADLRIDAANRGIEDRVMELIGRAGLKPAELREAISAIKISRELERVGDLAKNIAKRLGAICGDERPQAVGGVLRMGRISLSRISDVLDAYGHRSVERALAVWGGDDEIDEFYNSLFQEMLSSMMGDAKAVNACTHLVFVAKNFERVGDHATNVAEAVHFLVTGERIPAARPKTDVTPTTTVAPPDPAGAAPAAGLAARRD